jgi:hypothetical protein
LRLNPKEFHREARPTAAKQRAGLYSKSGLSRTASDNDANGIGCAQALSRPRVLKGPISRVSLDTYLLYFVASSTGLTEINKEAFQPEEVNFGFLFAFICRHPVNHVNPFKRRHFGSHMDHPAPFPVGIAGPAGAQRRP